MLVVPALARRRLVPLLARTNATLSADNTASKNSPPPPPPSYSVAKSKTSVTGTVHPPSSTPNSSSGPISVGGNNATVESSETGRGRRRRHIVKRRPQISLTNTRKWNPPVKLGSLPAYDEALKLVKEDSARLKKELRDVLARMAELEKELPGADVEVAEVLEKELQGLKEKSKSLGVQSQINLPWVRWYAANGMADLTKPVYRHLVEQKWRDHGALDLLMERIHQMHVVPDLLPSMNPSIDLRLSFPEPPPQSTYLRTRTRRKYKLVEPGVFLLPEQTRRAPRLFTSVFHPETRYYTLVLIDADVPDPENESFTTYLHWMQPNVALSAGSCGLLPTIPHTKYIPPHPQRGSPYHRYCLFVLPHTNAGEKLLIPPVLDEARVGFNVRGFCEEYGLDGSKGGGAHMWREEWDETASDIYKHTLKRREPYYGPPRRADPYADVKALKKLGK